MRNWCAAIVPPVSYSSISQLNLLLSQLEQASQQTQLDLAKLRVEKWKTDSNNKRQMQANVESVERNLQSALPEMIGQLKMSPENLTATFRVYRNLTALYDVFAAVAESAGAFGTKDDLKAGAIFRVQEAARQADGTYTASRISVGRDGARPF